MVGGVFYQVQGSSCLVGEWKFYCLIYKEASWLIFKSCSSGWVGGCCHDSCAFSQWMKTQGVYMFSFLILSIQVLLLNPADRGADGKVTWLVQSRKCLPVSRSASVIDIFLLRLWLGSPLGCCPHLLLWWSMVHCSCILNWSTLCHMVT